MINHTTTKQPELIPQTLVNRCLELGLACWNLDLNGMPVEDPLGPSMLSLWLSSRPVRSLLVEAAMIWSSAETVDVMEIHPGMWVFPFVEEHRERRIGYFIAIGFAPEILQSQHIAEGCEGNQLQIAALRHLLKDRAALTENHARQLYKMLLWTFGDGRQIQKQDQTIELFAEKLSDSYEVVTTLEHLGKSMGTLQDPGQIMLEGIEEIADTLDYNWVACKIVKEYAVLDEQTWLRQAGTLEFDKTTIESIFTMIQSTDPLGMADTTEVYPVDDVPEQLAPQLLVHPIKRNEETIGYLIAGGKNGDDPQISSHETKLMESISGMLGACMENAELYHRQHKTFIGTVQALSVAIDAKDQYTRGHSERVAMLSEMLARKIGYNNEDAERIRISGLVHDVGKIGVPEAVLCKPGRLDNDEFELIKQHPSIGYEIMKDIPDLQDILPGVLHHHERWDGKGYPAGLKGEDIPHMARIMAIADTFDAMSSNRAYRSGLSREKVVDEFRKCAGTQFDPDLVEPFLSLDFERYDEMVAKHKAQQAVVINEAA